MKLILEEQEIKAAVRWFVKKRFNIDIQRNKVELTIDDGKCVVKVDTTEQEDVQNKDKNN